MKIGIELEAGFLADSISDVTDLCNEIKAEFKGDGSVSTYKNGVSPREIATCPYEGEKSLPTIEKDFKQIYPFIGEINDSMGLHFHFSFENIGDFQALYNKRFVSFFKKELKEQFKDNPILLKRLNNRYCRTSYDRKYFQTGSSSSKDRYKCINWCSFQRHGTVEFRIFNSPDNPKELMTYLVFTIITIKKFLKNYSFGLDFDLEEEKKGLCKEEIEIVEDKKVIVIRGI